MTGVERSAEAVVGCCRTSNRNVSPRTLCLAQFRSTPADRIVEMVQEFEPNTEQVVAPFAPYRLPETSRVNVLHATKDRLRTLRIRCLFKLKSAK
jgi:hypothetical protein